MSHRAVMHDIKGSDFRDAREAAGLTQARVAELFQVHRTSVVRWETSARLTRGRAHAILRELRGLAERPAA